MEVFDNVCSPQPSQPVWSPWFLTFPTYLTSAVGFAKATTSRTKRSHVYGSQQGLYHCHAILLKFHNELLYHMIAVVYLSSDLFTSKRTFSPSLPLSLSPSLPLSLYPSISASVSTFVRTLLFRKCESGPLQAHDVPLSSTGINTDPLTQSTSWCQVQDQIRIRSISAMHWLLSTRTWWLKGSMLVCQRVYPKPGEDLGLGYLKMYMQEYIYVYIYILEYILILART